MMMKPLMLVFILVYAFAHSGNLIAQDERENQLYSEANRLFNEGKYRATIEELSSLEKKKGLDRLTKGFIAYWKGISASRLQDYPLAIAQFDKALGLDYSPKDINYEYGQALFATEKLEEARLQFSESVKKKHKRAVSLYYIGFISRELGEGKKALTFFKAIKKLEEKESKEVLQAAEMQIGDIFLNQIEKHPNAFKTVDTYVIPQYKIALGVNKESALARVIQEKIITLQRKYELVLFQLRNGRPTLHPPYFIRLAQELGKDTNVTFAPNETTIAKSKQESIFSRTSAIGRYTFYYENYLSIAPEFSFNYTRYFNRIPEIYRNDNLFMAPALRTTYEHSLFKKPASFLLDYDYNEIHRDINAKKELDFNSRAHAVTVGERFSYFLRGETSLRLRYRIFDSYQNSSDSTTTSLILEQIVALESNTLLLFMSYDRTRVKSKIFDTNAFTIRGDLLMSSYRGWFNPIIGFGLTSTDPINNNERGQETMINPSFRLNRNLGKNWKANLKYDYMKNSSKDEANFAFKKSLYGLELEYVF
jgi:hypothetical protein